jgi:hypothetical protein
MKQSEYSAGTILVSKRGNVFITDGTVNGDGYGVLIGEEGHTGNILSSTGFGNWCKWPIQGPASEEQIQQFIAKIHNTETIKKY